MQEDVKDVQREVEILNLVSDHPNVAELVNAFEDAHYVHLVGASAHGLILYSCCVPAFSARNSTTPCALQ